MNDWYVVKSKLPCHAMEKMGLLTVDKGNFVSVVDSLKSNLAVKNADVLMGA